MNQVHPLNHRIIELKHSVCKVEDHVYDFEIMIWNHVSDSGISESESGFEIIILFHRFI